MTTAHLKPGQPLFTVHTALPSECARQLEQGECDVALVPVGAYAAHPEWEVVPEVGIGCRGGFGHFLLIRAVEHASPMALSPFVYVQLIWSTGLGWLVFGDFPDRGTLIGMTIIISAGMLAVNWRQLRQGPASGPSSRPH